MLVNAVLVTKEITAASSIQPDNDNVWIGTENGLYKYKIASGKIRTKIEQKLILKILSLVQVVPAETIIRCELKF
jgi:ligand-binding sensor domain-containing protein